MRCSTVLTGDLNSGPRSPTLGALTGTLVDAFADSRPRTNATHPSRAPRSRIDHIPHSRDVGVEAAAVRPRSTSDHRGVLATLRIDPTHSCF
jgi:endonuclease/exonuclease/phosphatase family metal-dependent hydrolase